MPSCNIFTLLPCAESIVDRAKCEACVLALRQDVLSITVHRYKVEAPQSVLTRPCACDVFMIRMHRVYRRALHLLCMWVLHSLSLLTQNT